jgi:hypothetical protein
MLSRKIDLEMDLEMQLREIDREMDLETQLREKLERELLSTA